MVFPVFGFYGFRVLGLTSSLGVFQFESSRFGVVCLACHHDSWIWEFSGFRAWSRSSVEECRFGAVGVWE